VRPKFFEELYKQMEKNPDIWLLVGDLGYGGADKIRDDFPDRFLNCGASEQAMLDIAVGLAYEGKIPFCYTITPFFFRAFETIRTYINHERLNIKLIGSGRDQDYREDGFSHIATDVMEFFDLFTNIQSAYPVEVDDIPEIVKNLVKWNKPYFLSLER
jgi:transketolase